MAQMVAGEAGLGWRGSPRRVSFVLTLSNNPEISPRHSRLYKFCETSGALARDQHSCPVWRIWKPPSRPDPLPREHDALQCWSDRRQTRQQDVSEGFGVAHAIEASNLDQLASEDGF